MVDEQFSIKNFSNFEKKASTITEKFEKKFENFDRYEYFFHNFFSEIISYISAALPKNAVVVKTASAVL